MVEVIPLIEMVDGEYRANAEALAFIRSHKRRFGVIACAGKYRTGKSFMLNKLTNASPGFGVGESVNACTKGLWIAKSFYRVSEDMDALFIDTEGLDALDANDDSDVRIFTLALMLSSSFVYNSTGHIDEQSLSTLGLMTRVTDTIKANNAEVLTEHTPAFHWVLRDFSLRIEDKAGNAIDNATYLDNALGATSDASRDATRNSIRTFFGSRHLHTLPRPAQSDTVVDINSKPWLLSARFHEAIEGLRTALFESLSPFCADGKAVTGSMYAELCEHLATRAKSNIPILRDAWTLMMAVGARDAKDSFLSAFQSKMDEWSADEASVMRAAAAQLVQQTMHEFDDHVRREFGCVDTDVRSSLLHLIEEAAERRINAIGMDMKAIIKTNLDVMDHSVKSRPPLDVISVIKEAATTFADQYAGHVDAWRAQAFERSTCRWLPGAIRDEQRKMAEELSAVKQELDGKLRSSGDELAKSEASAREATVKGDAAVASMEDERKAHEETRTQLTLTMAEKGMLEARVVELRTSLERDSEEALSTDATKSKAVHDAEVRYDAVFSQKEEALQKLSEGTMRVEVLTSKLDTRTHELEACKSRIQQLNDSWEQGLTAVRKDAEEAIRVHEHRCMDLDTQVRTLDGKLEDVTAERDAGCEQLAAATAKWDREQRQLQEVADRNREMCEKAQERIVGMHQSTLDDLRHRDGKVREMQTQFVTERANMNVKYDETEKQLHSATNANTELKRRVTDLEEAGTECKRLRVEMNAMQAHKIREDTEREEREKHIATLTVERDDLRRMTLRQDNEIAVLAAEKKMRDTRGLFATKADD